MTWRKVLMERAVRIVDTFANIIIETVFAGQTLMDLSAPYHVYCKRRVDAWNL